MLNARRVTTRMGRMSSMSSSSNSYTGESISILHIGSNGNKCGLSTNTNTNTNTNRRTLSSVSSAIRTRLPQMHSSTLLSPLTYISTTTTTVHVSSSVVIPTATFASSRRTTRPIRRTRSQSQKISRRKQKRKIKSSSLPSPSPSSSKINHHATENNNNNINNIIKNYPKTKISKYIQMVYLNYFTCSELDSYHDFFQYEKKLFPDTSRKIYTKNGDIVKRQLEHWTCTFHCPITNQVMDAGIVHKEHMPYILLPNNSSRNINNNSNSNSNSNTSNQVEKMQLQLDPQQDENGISYYKKKRLGA